MASPKKLNKVAVQIPALAALILSATCIIAGLVLGFIIVLVTPDLGKFAAPVIVLLTGNMGWRLWGSYLGLVSK